MPNEVVPETTWGPRSFGLADARTAQVQIKYATEQLHYPVWGMSPSSTPTTPATTAASVSRAWRSRTTGRAPTPADPNHGLSQCHGCATEDVVTPHASFLALDVAPQQAYANIQALRTLYPGVYGADGFFDAVNPVTGAVGHRDLVLDQSMIMASLDNALNDRAIQRHFASDPVGRGGTRVPFAGKDVPLDRARGPVVDHPGRARWARPGVRCQARSRSAPWEAYEILAPQESGPPAIVNRYLLPEERQVITVRMHPAALIGPGSRPPAAWWRPGTGPRLRPPGHRLGRVRARAAGVRPADGCLAGHVHRHHQRACAHHRRLLADGHVDFAGRGAGPDVSPLRPRPPAGLRLAGRCFRSPPAVSASARYLPYPEQLYLETTSLLAGRACPGRGRRLARVTGLTSTPGSGAQGVSRPSSASKLPSSRRSLTVVRKRAASAPSTSRWS